MSQPHHGIRLELLGKFRVTVEDREIEPGAWRLRRAAALVKLLVLAPGRQLHREYLLDLLWPELEPAAAANNLRYALHTARRILNPDPSATDRYLRWEGDQLTFCRGLPLWSDVEAFESAANTAHQLRTADAYEAAIALYGGDLLPDDPFEEWATARRDTLRERYLSLLVAFATLLAERAEPGRAIETLRRAIVFDPASEAAHVALMRLYAECGQRQQALRQYQQLAEVLRRELGAEPDEESQALFRTIQAGGIPVRPSVSARQLSGNVPADASSFVGRAEELAEITRLLASSRLLTLTGAGGSGKTRLGLKAAVSLRGGFPDGVWLVELAALSDPALVPQAVAAALGVRESVNETLVDSLAASLRSRRLLLVVDNCEHVLRACARLVAALLRGAPDLTVLATSRERLGLTGETVWRVPPMNAADAQGLFIERAVEIGSAFPLNDATGAVEEICRRLDGLPLALELAAARTRVLSPKQIAARLDDRFRLLTGGDPTGMPRTRTLCAALDWSHDLLSANQQRLFRRLAVFAGGFDLDAIEGVCADPAPGLLPAADVLDLLMYLVDKSLVLVENGEGATRYRLLESIRQYAEDRLIESGEVTAVRLRHRSWFLRLAERAELAAWGGPGHKAALDRVEQAHDNLRAALTWSIAGGDAAAALRLAAALGRFWEVRGYFVEGARRLAEALRCAGDVPPLVRARALNAAGRLVLAEGNPRGAEPLLTESLQIFRDLGNDLGTATVLFGLGWARFLKTDYDGAIPHYAESLTLYRRLPNPLGAAAVLIDLGIAQYRRGRPAEAVAALEEALALFRAAQDQRGMAWALYNLATVALFSGNDSLGREQVEQSLHLCRTLGDNVGVARNLGLLGSVVRAEGDLEHAAALYREAIAILWQIGERRDIAINLENLARIATIQQQPDRALLLAGAAAALRERMDTPLPANVVAGLDAYLARARAAAGAHADRAWTTGRTMPLEQVVAEALNLSSMQQFP